MFRAEGSNFCDFSGFCEGLKARPEVEQKVCLGIAEARRRKAIANYDYNLNGVFFKDLKLADPDV